MWSRDHGYAISADAVGSRRTEALHATLSCVRETVDEDLRRSTVDERFLWRASTARENVVLRPARCVIGYAEYRSRLRRSSVEMMDLHHCLLSKTRLTTYLRRRHGTFITLSWPVHKYLQIVDDRMMRYDSVIDRLRQTYPLCDDWLLPVGVIVGSGETFYSDYNHPVLLVTGRRYVLLHVREEPSWLLSGGASRERLYVAADSVWTLARDGLSRCDWCYTEAGGAPYATVADEALRDLVSAKTRRDILPALKNKWRRHRWMINGCPGALHDRVFRLRDEDAPTYILDHLKELYGDAFYLLGYILRDKEPAVDCELFVLVDEELRVFVYAPEPEKIRYVAETLDTFFRIGTRRFYLNYELYPRGRFGIWDEPTCYPISANRDRRLLGSEYADK